MASEAYVKINEVLIDAPAAASANAAMLIAGAIKAKAGDFEPTYFTSRQAFLDKYTIDGKLSGQEDISFINAYEVLGTFPILVVRSFSKDYSAKRVTVKDASGKEYFALVFNDYFCDPKHQVVMSMKPDVNYPGAIKLSIKYNKLSDFTKYEIASISTPGSGYKLGDNVTLKDALGRTLKARVFDVYDDRETYYTNEISGLIYDDEEGELAVGDRITLRSREGNEVLVEIESVSDSTVTVTLLKGNTAEDISGTYNSESGNLQGNVTSTLVDSVAEGAIKTLKLLTYVLETEESDPDTVSAWGVSGGSGSGANVSLNPTLMDPEEVKSYEVTFSLDSDVYDDQGRSLFYQNVWQDEWPFSIEIGTAVPIQKTIANPYVESDPTQPDTLTYLQYHEDSWTGEEDKFNSTIDGESAGNTALADEVAANGARWSAKFEVYEDRQIPIFSDFGTEGVGTYLKPLAEQFYGMYLNSLPRNRESVTGAQTWDEIDLGNSRRWVGTPFAQTTHLGFLAYIAPTTQYINTLGTNSAAGREFEAIAGNSTGIVNYTGLTKNYDKADREALLDLKINTITYREVDGYAMFNDDLTGLVQNNPFKEEFNRRLGIEIAQSIETLMKQFLFKLNTPALRSTIQSTIENYLDTASFRQKFENYQVICDDTNNPAWLQAQNKLAVTVNISFYYTAKYIEVTNKIYSVGQSFTD